MQPFYLICTSRWKEFCAELFNNYVAFTLCKHVDGSRPRGERVNFFWRFKTVAIRQPEWKSEGKLRKKLKTGYGGFLAFQNIPKCNPIKDVLRLNISRKFKSSSCNNEGPKGEMVKSLHTLRWWRQTQVKPIVSTTS